jgi:hypothetical protein
MMIKIKEFSLLNSLFYRNNIGKPVVFLWADALRDFVDKSPNTNERK